MSSLRTFSCDLCVKTFAKQFNLNRHYNNIHSRYIPDNGDKRLFNCPICNCDVGKLENLNGHILSVHKIILEKESLRFANENDFFVWKKSVEENEKAIFINRRGIYRSNNKKILYYQCHRSGCYKSSLSSPLRRKRSIKIQGSQKINKYCPAKIKASVLADGSVEVDFCRTHLGHEPEVAHLRLQADERKQIATKIAGKVPFENIISDIQETVTDEIKRKHLLTKQDLRNIVREYSLDSECVRHANDAISVERWVELEYASEKNSVILYKAFGVCTEQHPNLSNDDFMLGIMSEAQAEILKKYGGDCICIDSIHGTNAYGFEMTTIMVLDDMHQGFPCAFFFSNKGDHTAIETFLLSIKNKVGEIKAKVLMTDMAEVFYNSWKAVMGDVNMRLFCTWHVQRAWQKRLNTDVKNLDKRKETSKKLFALQTEVDEKNFKIMMPVIMNELINSPETKEFGLYFEENYSKNYKSWAYCYRRNAGINTNMNLERLHGIFEHLFLKGKIVKHLDLTLHALIRLVKCKLFDGLVVLHEGKLTYKVRNIRERHKKALKLSFENVIPSSDNSWLVFSASTECEIYTVSNNNIQCNCSLSCDHCKACIHEFHCTCIDSCVKWNMCQHIHLVCRKMIFDKQRESILPTPLLNNENDQEQGRKEKVVINETNVIVSAVSNVFRKESEFSSLEEMKSDANNQFIRILNKVNSVEQMEVIKKVLKSLEPQVDTLHKEFSSLKSDSKKIDIRKRIELQRKFKLKKKKCSVNRLKLKPTVEEVHKIRIDAVLKSNKSDDPSTSTTFL